MISARLLNSASIALRLANFGPVVRKRMQASFERRADRAIDEMKANVAVESGHLRDSIRREDNPHHYPGVRIIAGGTPETSRPSKSGVTYDEALLLEYGTEREQAQPFFRPAIERYFGEDAAEDIKPGDLENA